MAKRTATNFSRKQIWEIATKYANTNCAYSRDYFSREYDINYSTFYKLLERAVIESIVDEATILRMADKAAHNSDNKAGEGARKRSQKHYEYLILKRKVYILPKKEAINLTTNYANSVLAKPAFLRNNFMDAKLFDRTLYKAILENWVSDEVVEKLKTKSLRYDSSEKVIAFWDQLLKYRNENKKNQG